MTQDAEPQRLPLLIRVNEASALLGVSEKDLWAGVHLAGVKEVFKSSSMMAHFRRKDLAKIAEATLNIPFSKPKKVYIVRMGTRGHYKIGVAADHVSRLIQLQVSSPYQLQVEHVEIGNFSLERKIHRMLAEHRTQGEWFSPHRDVVAFVKHAKRHGIMSAIEAYSVGISTGKPGGK